jgi:putative tryptophan/tyrosine transport system substrate-binding protein
VKRRDFITLLGGAAAAWPLAAQAQQPERMHRIGVLMNLAADDALGQARQTAFVRALEELGWADGRNVRIDIRWGAGDADRYRKYAAELVAFAPDVILATSGATMPALVRPAPCRSFSCRFPTRLARASSRPGATGWQRYRVYPV